MAATVVYHEWDFTNTEKSWNGLLLLIEDLARVPTMTEEEAEAYVIVSSARLGDRGADKPQTHDLPVAPIVTLSVKETACLVLMALGLTNNEIAGRTGVGMETAKSTVGRVMRKLSAADRSHAVAIGLRRGLIGEDGAMPR